MGNRTLDTLEEIAVEIDSAARRDDAPEVIYPILLLPPATPKFFEFSYVNQPADHIAITPLPEPELDAEQIDEAIMEMTSSINKEMMDMVTKLFAEIDKKKKNEGK